MLKSSVLILILQVFVASTLKLPSYLKKCHMKKPDYNKCLMDNFQRGIKELSLNGDPGLKIKRINFIETDALELQATPSLNVTLHEVEFMGFEDGEPKHIELTEDKLIFQTYFELLKCRGKAKLAGKLLIFVLNGDGDIEVDYQKAVITYTADLKTYKKNGRKFIRIIRDHSDPIPGGLILNVKNVFDFNSQVGENLNKLVNMYWREIHEETKEGISTVLSVIFRKIVQKYFNQIPIDELIEQ